MAINLIHIPLVVENPILSQVNVVVEMPGNPRVGADFVEVDPLVELEAHHGLLQQPGMASELLGFDQSAICNMADELVLVHVFIQLLRVCAC